MKESRILGIQDNVEDIPNDTIDNLEFAELYETSRTATVVPNTLTIANSNAETGFRLHSWHIPRPSLLGRKSKKDNDNDSWAHHLHPNSSSRGSTSSQGSMASTHSAASGTLLLTAANLTSLAAMHPPMITAAKPTDTASVASSTHFTVINGIGRPTVVYEKSWCARNQLTVLVCTMSFLFMIGLLACILFMEVRARDKYNSEKHRD